MISITLAIVIITSIVSVTAFSNQKVTEDLIFYPPAIKNRNQWYRFLSCALIHGDVAHLAFNMLSFYGFGQMVEQYFSFIFHGAGGILYVALYLLSQVLCLVPTYFKNQDNYSYRSLGASGAVSAVIFVGIFLNPLSKIGFFFIPIGIPGFIFGILFLIISVYLDRRGHGNINHSAHFWGALAGIILFIIFSYSFHFDAIGNFVYQIRSYVGV